MNDEVWEKFYSATEEEFCQLPYLTIGKLRKCINQISELYDDYPIKIVSKSDKEDSVGEIRPVKLIDNNDGLELYTTKF